MGEELYQSRALNFLKIVMMICVVGLHFLSHGNYLLYEKPFSETWGGVWIIRSFIMVCVNCFVMVTGYYLCEKKIKITKILRLMDGMLFYSVIISIIIWCLKFPDISVIQILNTIFPFMTGSYWFMSCYIVLYLIAPLINIVIRSITFETFTRYIFVCVMLFSIIPTVFSSFSGYSIDRTNGYGVIWFIVLYLTGAWLRKTNFKFKKKYAAVGVYIGASLCTFLITISVKFFAMSGVAPSYINYELDYIGYNYFSVYIASIGCFLLFKNLRISKQYEKIIMNISSLTLGVYLISEHPILRNILFTDVFHCDQYIGSLWFLVAFVLVVFTVFSVCCMIDI